MPRKYSHIQEHEKEILELRSQGMTLREIGEKLASKAKGLWTGGVPKLGYDIKDKKLVINPVEAEQVRSIFEGYLQCGSLAELEKFAEIKGFKQKNWVTNKGEQRGGKPFKISALHRLLHEKLYLGMIENKRTGQAFKGQHEAIILHYLAHRQELPEGAKLKTLERKCYLCTDIYEPSLIWQ